MTMTLHKLSAGHGYTYLTSQVACDDNELGRTELGEYYSEKGESPGRWWGAGLEALGVSGAVSEAQMLALFGEGRHPNATEIEAELIRQGYSPAAALSVTKLGQAYKVSEGSSEWQRRLAIAYAAHNSEPGPQGRRRDRGGPARGHPLPGRCRLLRRDLRPGAPERPGADRIHHPGIAADLHRGRRLRPDLLTGQVGLCAVGRRASPDPGRDPRGARGGRGTVAGVDPEPRCLHPAR